jgi:hypothetical protein
MRVYWVGRPCVPGRNTSSRPCALTDAAGLIATCGASPPAGAAVIAGSVDVALTCRSAEAGGLTVSSASLLVAVPAAFDTCTR